MDCLKGDKNVIKQKQKRKKNNEEATLLNNTEITETQLLFFEIIEIKVEVYEYGRLIFISQRNCLSGFWHLEKELHYKSKQRIANKEFI